MPNSKAALHVSHRGKELVKLLPDHTLIIATDITLDEARKAIEYLALALAEQTFSKD